MPTLGEVAYEAYRRHTDGKSAVTGLAIPPWPSLASEIKSAWEAAGKAVSALHLPTPYED